MISLNRFIMTGLYRMNIRGLSRVLLSKNRVVDVKDVHQLVNLNTLMKTSSVRHVVDSRNRKFSSQSSEAPLEDLQQDSRKEKPSTGEIFEEIAAGDPECFKKLKMLEFEVEVLREEEHRVPDRITKKNWLELLEMNNVSLRRKYLAFLRLNELKTASNIQKHALKNEMNQQLKEELGFHYYGLSGHSLFMRIYNKTVFKILKQRLLLNNRLEVVLDCSYQNYMSDINTRLCAKQIAQCISVVKFHKYPCSLRLCNYSEDDALGKAVPLYTQLKDHPFCPKHSESYLDIFPKEKLVYLSPHTTCTLSNFNHDDVFIIGAYVDRGTSVKASLAKAKEHNLRIAKLPIDEYLYWKKGTKSLPLSTVLNIILDMAYYSDWRVALKRIPKRCLTE